MSPKQLNELLQEIKGELAEINAAWLVVDDSQLTRTIGERSQDDNMFLVGVMPNYGTRGFNADAHRETVAGMILILALDIRRGLITFLVALSLVGWGEIAQYIRGEFIGLRERLP